MTNKNSPLRIIDQKPSPYTPPPPAQPTKFNPYTGGVIRNSSESTYLIFLQPSTKWDKRTFRLKKFNTPNSPLIEVSTKIPRLILRLLNPNADIQKLRIFLSFESSIFDTFDDGEFVTSDDPTPNVVSFTTTTVTHVGNNNRAVGNLDITPHIERLINRYTLYELLRAAGVELDEATYNSQSDDSLVELFYKSMYSIEVFAQAMYQDLVDSNESNSSNFLYRVPISCAYSLSPNYLTGGDISAVRARFTNDIIYVNFNQTALRLIELAVYDTSLNDSETEANLVYENNFVLTERAVEIQIPGSWFNRNRLEVFNQQVNVGLTSMDSLYSYNTRYKVVIRRVVDLGNVITQRARIPTLFGVSTEYTVFSPNFNDVAVSVLGNYAIDFINNGWQFALQTGNSADFGGILIVYKYNTQQGVRFLPRLLVTDQIRWATHSTLWTYGQGSTRKFFIFDFFRNSKASDARPTFKASIPNGDIIDISFIPVSPTGRLSNRTTVYTYNKISLNRRLESTGSTIPLNGFYNFRLTHWQNDVHFNYLGGQQLADYVRQRVLTRLYFKVRLERLVNNKWTDITRVVVANTLFYISAWKDPTNPGLSMGINGISDIGWLQLFPNNSGSFVKGNKYRITFYPVIAPEFRPYLLTSDYLYLKEFTA